MTAKRTFVTKSYEKIRSTLGYFVRGVLPVAAIALSHAAAAQAFRPEMQGRIESTASHPRPCSTSHANVGKTGRNRRSSLICPCRRLTPTGAGHRAEEVFSHAPLPGRWPAPSTMAEWLGQTSAFAIPFPAACDAVRPVNGQHASAPSRRVHAPQPQRAGRPALASSEGHGAVTA